MLTQNHFEFGPEVVSGRREEPTTESVCAGIPTGLTFRLSVRRRLRSSDEADPPKMECLRGVLLLAALARAGRVANGPLWFGGRCWHADRTWCWSAREVSARRSGAPPRGPPRPTHATQRSRIAGAFLSPPPPPPPPPPGLPGPLHPPRRPHWGAVWGQQCGPSGARTATRHRSHAANARFAVQAPPARCGAAGRRARLSGDDAAVGLVETPPLAPRRPPQVTQPGASGVGVDVGMVPPAPHVKEGSANSGHAAAPARGLHEALASETALRPRPGRPRLADPGRWNAGVRYHAQHGCAARGTSCAARTVRVPAPPPSPLLSTPQWAPPTRHHALRGSFGRVPQRPSTPTNLAHKRRSAGGGRSYCSSTSRPPELTLAHRRRKHPNLTHRRRHLPSPRRPLLPPSGPCSPLGCVQRQHKVRCPTLALANVVRC